MKKLICLLLVCALLFGAASVWADDPFDLTYVRTRTSDYEISVDNDRDCAFITSTFKVKELAFSHPDESDQYYSYLWWDILVLDYNESSRYPIFRLWISTATENSYKNFKSVSFIFGGKEYIFTNISSANWFEIKDGDYMQDMLIKIGNSNLDFVIDLLTYIGDVGISNCNVKMVLHGDVDYTVSLNANNLTDFVRIAGAMSECNGIPLLTKATNPNPLTIKNA